MLSIDGALLDFKRLDNLANGDSPIHRLDPRAKVLATLVFIVTVVSFGRYELAAMLPFFVFPAAVIGSADLPAGYIAKKVALLCPFALMVAIFNPLFDREIMISLGPVGISGGWVSCLSILLRASLTVGAAIILLAVTGFPAICRALERLGMPPAFAVQLLFLYRYIFVLTEEGGRASRARDLRSFGKKGLGMRVYGSLLGSLLIRTWQRAERIHMAMLARGFTGEFHTRHTFRFGARETVFLLGWSLLFIFLRFQNVPRLLGTLLSGIIS
jgi:cobalt/nickel transport system permease protein